MLSPVPIIFLVKFYEYYLLRNPHNFNKAIINQSKDKFENLRDN
jgi:hypothetical protein